ncbi:DBF4-type zinc finger-containing protein 2 isoform X1 [Python bivittatus]|uniref:DBF4-type zinc finger-containing protein 2 isoform X1 n=2 Tax=Python bivittatus TaxID=176946 RepID=A0A9F2R5T1_PYTBI|nr:DBF4-type zinc finger-containing protein 2 isoform X1 [Python bivittatus]
MEMFDHNKQADEANVSSAQGMERKVNEGSLWQDSNSSLNIQGSELSKTGVPVMQNRQGYCNCCHAPYSNLEQHVYSSQHRHFVSYCRNRMGTTSLMERFLQDVLQHHPYRYYDNRPTYDDMPFNSQLLARDGAALSVEVKEKERDTSRVEDPNTESGLTAESGCLISQSHEKLKKASEALLPIQTLGRGQQPNLGASQRTMDISSNTNNLGPTSILTENNSQKFTAKDVLPHPLPVSQLSSTPHRLAKNIRYPVTTDLVLNDIREQTNQDICNQDGFLNSNESPVLQSVPSKTVSHSHESPVYNKGNSLISGQLFLKQDELESQDETQINFCLRNTRKPVGTSNSLTFQATSQLSRQKEHLYRSAESSINEIIEQVILKYCYEAPPKELPCREEDANSCVNILSLLDHSSLHGSDISFDCDAAVDSGANLPKLTVKNLELLKEVKVNLQDENYGTQLSSIFNNVSMPQVAEAENDISVQNEEPVLPALPHVPPSFVGKTWSQIMYEDDMKIEALVRDFREGRFRCHFDTESLAHRTQSRLRKKPQKSDERINTVAANKTDAGSTKGVPEFTDGLSDGPDFSNLSATSEIHVPKPLKNPKKRIWRLASRCQVVKVSHGTQTSLVQYPVVKQKVIRKDYQLQDQMANLLWSENEKTPAMKTRLCALRLPKSYTKIMSPLQPQTVVYVLSCPETKQSRNKAEEVPKIKSHSSTDSKDSVRYKYKQTSIKYYDPLTNRILKTPPKCVPGEKTKKPTHVRQLFRNLNLDGNRKKQADTQYMSKSFNSPDNHASAASLLLDPVKENDMNSSHHKTDESSISTERSECLVYNCSEKCCKPLFVSPLNSHQSEQESDFQFNPFNRKGIKCPLKSHTADHLERDNPKKIWQRKKINSRESGFPKKTSGLIFVKHDLVKKGSRKQPPRSTTQQIERKIKKISSCTLKSSILRHHSKKTTIAKHLQKEKADIKKLTVSRKPKGTFLNTAAGMGVPEKRQRATVRTSSKVKAWEMTRDKNLFCTVK